MPNTFEDLNKRLQQAIGYVSTGQLADAERVYKGMLDIAPDNAAVNHNLGTLLLATGRVGLGVAHHKTAYEAQQGDQRFWVAYINALLAAKRAHEAQAVLEQGMQRWSYAGEDVRNLVASLHSARQANSAVPQRAVPLPDVDDEVFYGLLEKAFPYSMSGLYGFVDSFFSLYQMVNYVVKYRIPGDFVECGCYAGGMSLLAALTFLKHGDTSRHFYLFDTFEGMPAPTAEDGAEAGHAYAANTQNGQAWAKMDIEAVRSVMSLSGYPAERIHLIKGMVEDTIPQKSPKRISILRLDTDFYASTKHELIHLYPRLVAGGALVIDDYGYMTGARAATDEYFASPDRPMLLNRVNFTVRTGIKR
jgi:hypothetical protein